MAAGGGGAACAACKYQRRRCTADCPLAEFFPHDRPRVFRNAHRLFGVSNIVKTLRRAGPDRRREAMHCIIYESHAWDVYPAAGCLPIIFDLRRQIRHARLELAAVYDAINAYRAAAGQSDDAGELPPPSSLFNYDEQAATMMMMDNDDDPAAASSSSADDDTAAILAAAAAAAAAPPLRIQEVPTWMMPHYDGTTPVAADMTTAAGVVPQLLQHQSSVDATTTIPQSQLQQLLQQYNNTTIPVPIQPESYDDDIDETSYLVDDNINEQMPCSTDSPEKKMRMKEPKLEGANCLKQLDDATSCFPDLLIATSADKN